LWSDARHPSDDPSTTARLRLDLRDNMTAALERGETLFPSLVGYEDTVIRVFRNDSLTIPV
jgi:hypothetical protein